jgi:hypothetical protein
MPKRSTDPPDIDLEALEVMASSDSADHEEIDRDRGVKDQNIKPGTNAKRARSTFYVQFAIAIIVLGSFVALLGLMVRKDLRLLSWIKREPKFELVESRSDTVLMLETVGDQHRVIVQDDPQGNWLLVSRDDFATSHPSLSPEASRVAYLSTGDSPSLVIVGIDNNNERLILSNRMLESAAVAAELPVTHFCEWTNLAWDPTGQRVAFWGCREENPRSVAFVATRQSDTLIPELVKDSGIDRKIERQLQWSGPDHLILSFPTSDGSSLKTLPAP